MATIMITNMPFWAERIGVPRTLGVETPFGHIIGKPGDKDGQRVVLLEALDVLEQSEKPGTIIHSQTSWSGTAEEARAAAHPDLPPPIMNQMGRHIGNFLRNIRRTGS